MIVKDVSPKPRFDKPHNIDGSSFTGTQHRMARKYGHIREPNVIFQNYPATKARGLSSPDLSRPCASNTCLLGWCYYSGAAWFFYTMRWESSVNSERVFVFGKHRFLSRASLQLQFGSFSDSLTARSLDRISSSGHPLVGCLSGRVCRQHLALPNLRPIHGSFLDSLAGWAASQYTALLVNQVK